MWLTKLYKLYDFVCVNLIDILKLVSIVTVEVETVVFIMGNVHRITNGLITSSD